MNTLLFETIKLTNEDQIFISLPIPNFQLSSSQFQEIWDLHPETYHIIRMHGKEIPTPRWQQAYGKNYNYTGAKNNALPIPYLLKPFLVWSQNNIDTRLNGLLLNWYDGEKNHYIGPHRDATTDLLSDSPIVTISLGQERIFRLRPYGGSGYKDLTFRNAEVIVLPAKTNRNWTHEIPKSKKYIGKRISVTLRAYL